MDELAVYLSALEGLAQELISLKLSDSATLNYHTLADAIYWSDEIPRRLSATEDDAIRFLLRYRTSTILGAPEEQYKRFWEAGKRYFPSWIGFIEARIVANPTLLGFYQRQVVRLDRRLKRIIDNS